MASLGNMEANTSMAMVSGSSTYNLITSSSPIISFQPEKITTIRFHSRSKHWQLINLVITQRQDRQNVTIIRNIRGAGCCTDYGLIQSLQIKVRLALQKHARANRFNCAPFPEAQILEMRNGLVSTLNIIPVILITLVVRPSPRSGTPLPLPTRNHH